MIKETCSCGATFEVSFTHSSSEQTVVSEWRAEHKHDWRSNTQKAMEDALEEGWKPLSQRDPIQQTTTTGVLRDASWENQTHPAFIGRGKLTAHQLYVLNEDYVHNGMGEPVWIGNRPMPAGFPAWAAAFKAGWDMTDKPVKSDSGLNTV